MSIPLIALGLGALALAGGGQGTKNTGVVGPIEPSNPEPAIKLKVKTVSTSKAPMPGHTIKPTNAPLPAQALAAIDAGGYRKGVNSIRAAGQWVRFATFSPKFHYRHRNMRVWSKPAGAYKIKVEDRALALAWMMQCPSKWYLKYGYRDRSARLDVLKKFIGPGADFKIITGGAEDLLSELPDLIESAGLVAGAVASGGASASQDPMGQIGQVTETLKDLGGIIKNAKSANAKRSAAAKVAFLAIARQYLDRVKQANPHAVKNGKLVLSKSFKKEPKTYADLWEPGNARPILYNPPLGWHFEKEWPNR